MGFPSPSPSSSPLDGCSPLSTSQNARQRADDLAQAAVVAAADNSYPRAPGGGGSESNRGLGLRRTLTSLSFYEDSANAERQQQHRPAPDETTAVLSPRYGGSLRNYRTTSDTPTYSMPGRTPRGGSPVATRTRSIYGDRGPTDLDEADEDEHGGSSARDEKKESWWTKAVSPLQSIELENHGSVARDHLALGRCSPLRLGSLGVTEERVC